MRHGSPSFSYNSALRGEKRDPDIGEVKEIDGFGATTFTTAQVLSSTENGKKWVIIEGKVYDLAPLFVQHMHPGGLHVLSALLGRDATDPFLNSHPASTRSMLPQYELGAVSDYIVDAPTAAYRTLRSQLQAEGTLSKGGCPAYYAATTSRIVGCASILAGLLLSTRAWEAHLLGAVLLGIFWQQLAFVGHDLGHSGISGSRAVDAFRGLLFGPALTGISFSWWKATHNAHHVSTNSAELDPDVQHMPLIAMSPHFFGSLWSHFHAKRMFFSSCTRIMVKRQHLFFFPLMFWARWNLYFQGVCDLALGAHTQAGGCGAEALALLFFFTWVSCAVCLVGRGQDSVLGALLVRLAFLIISNGVAGGLHMQIVLSHFSQPITLKEAAPSVSFLEGQLSGTLNIVMPPELDFLFGGLQFQIEHHVRP